MEGAEATAPEVLSPDLARQAGSGGDYGRGPGSIGLHLGDRHAGGTGTTGPGGGRGVIEQVRRAAGRSENPRLGYIGIPCRDDPRK